MSNASSPAQELQADLQGKVQALQSLLLSQEPDLGLIATLIQQFEQLFSEKASFLPSYDVKKLQSAILAIKEDYQRRYQSTQPKKRFAFKSRTAIKTREEIQARQDRKAPEVKTVAAPVKATLYDKRNESIHLETEDMDPLITRLSQCEVRLTQSVPSTVHMTDLVDCTIILGPVTTSVFVERCKGCTFYIYCQQLRMHDSKDCSVYLHVTSKGIIEGCSNVGFGPYVATFQGLEDRIRSSGLNKSVNHWNEIQDFNWLTPDQASPNWYTISDEDRRIVSIE